MLKAVLTVYVLVAGVAFLPLTRPLLMRWYRQQRWFIVGKGPVDILFKQIGFRLTFEAFIFAVSCVLGAAGGWLVYLVLLRKARPAQTVEYDAALTPRASLSSTEPGTDDLPSPGERIPTATEFGQMGWREKLTFVQKQRPSTIKWRVRGALLSIGIVLALGGYYLARDAGFNEGQRAAAAPQPTSAAAAPTSDAALPVAQTTVPPTAAPAPPELAPAQPAPSLKPIAQKVGDCASTRVARIGSRLEGDPDSGSTIDYENGAGQTGYEVVPGIIHSQIGDPVQLCVTSFDQTCKPEDKRGRTYSSTNLRTLEKWTAADSEHQCAGE